MRKKKIIVVKENYEFKTKPIVLFRGCFNDLSEDTSRCTLSRLLGTGFREKARLYSKQMKDLHYYASILMSYDNDREFNILEEALMTLNIEDPKADLIDFTVFNSFRHDMPLHDMMLNDEMSFSDELEFFTNRYFSMSKQLRSWLERHEPEALEEVEIEVN